jgi:hypothetical protein
VKLAQKEQHQMANRTVTVEVTPDANVFAYRVAIDNRDVVLAGGIDAPVYFAPDDKNNLVGGLDFGWRSDRHQLIAGIFVESAFSIF